MGARLKTETDDGTISVCDMKDGQLGVVTRFDSCQARVGVIVQRHGNDLFFVGVRADIRSIDLSDWGVDTTQSRRVRILKTGELIEVTDNE